MFASAIIEPMTNKQAPIEVNRPLIQRNLAGLIYQLTPRNERDIELAARIAPIVIDDVIKAWNQLLAKDSQASQWGFNGRYLRTRSILVEWKHGVSEWSTEYELVRYLVWSLLPQEPVAQNEPNLLDGSTDALDTRMAFYLARKGTPKAPGDVVYGWADSEKQFHVRVCPILRVTEVHEDQWDQFNDTFAPNTVQHGLTGVGSCQCGYVNGELRVQADLSEMMSELLRAGA